jgi:hypothetical protein
MAIKDKVKKAAQALKKDDPPTSNANATATKAQPTSVPPPSKTSSTKSTPAPASAAKTSAPTSIQIPKSNGSNANGNTNGVKTPKTPQDEAIAFFSSGSDGQPVQVWELWLEDDGGPGDNKSVRRVLSLMKK